VGRVIEPDPDAVFLPADLIDAVVVFSRAEQSGTVPHRRSWSLFTPESDVSPAEGIERLRFINRVLRITPRRNAADAVLARLAASILTEQVHKGAFVNVGTGLPEEVCRLLAHEGLTDDVTLFTEGGTMGGVPAPGIFFGAAVRPIEIISSCETFRRCRGHLDVTLLGMLQADGRGNVNVSKRGEGAIHYVGAGGLMDFTAAADTICFISSWMTHAQIAVKGGRIRVRKTGKPKFLHAVDEVTFSGNEALRAGKKVLFATHVGVFELTERGMTLVRVMPGVDVQRDILDATPMRVVLPDTGPPEIVDSSIVTGQDFRLAFRDPPA